MKSSWKTWSNCVFEPHWNIEQSLCLQNSIAKFGTNAIISSVQSSYQRGTLSFLKFKIIIRNPQYFPFILRTACSRTHHLYIAIISPRPTRIDKFCNNTFAAVIGRWISIWFIFISLVLNKWQWQKLSDFYPSSVGRHVWS